MLRSLLYLGSSRYTHVFIPPVSHADDRLHAMSGRGWRVWLRDGSSPRQHSPRWDLRRSQRRPPPRQLEADGNTVHQDSSALMRLPVEVRLQIYRLVFSQIRFRWGFVPPDRPLCRGYGDGEFVTPDADLALLRVCRKMHCEIGDSWLGQVLFFAEDQTSLIRFLDRNPITRRHIRRVVVREHPGGCPTLATGLPGGAGSSHGQTLFPDPAVALSLMGTTLDAVPLADALAALPGLQLDVLTVLSSGDPWNGYRSLDRFVTHGSGFRVLEFATPHSLMLKHKDLLISTSRLCRPGLVAPRAPQPAGWDAKAKERDGEDSGAGVRLFRASVWRALPQPQSPVVDDDDDGVLNIVEVDDDGRGRYYYSSGPSSAGSDDGDVYEDAVEEQEEDEEDGGDDDQDQSQSFGIAEEPIIDAACLRPFAVLDPALRTEWAQTAAPDDPAREVVAWWQRRDAEARMLERELDRELLFVVRRGRGATDVRVPRGNDAALGRAWWSCCPDGLCVWCIGAAGRSFRASVSWEEQEQGAYDYAPEDGPGEGPSSGRPLSATQRRGRFRPAEEHPLLSVTRSGRRQMAMEADRRTAARVYLDNFRFLYPYQGTYMDAIIGHDIAYSVTRDRCWGGKVDEYGTWGIFGALDRYMAD